ncbi:MAG: hypothetical protein K5842_06335 [Bacteroidales bacterium]|nr:hypothetical protein [Bacteroidales bacterium]
MARYPFFQQADAMDCGAACLRMICAKYGRHYLLDSHYVDITSGQFNNNHRACDEAT